MRIIAKQSFIAFALLALIACGSSSTNSTTAACSGDNVTTACTDNYQLTFDAPNQKTGKSTFTVTVKDHSGAPMSGATLSLNPWMRMETMNHTSVVDTITDNGDGTYTCLVYYMMPSAMNGVSMGTWDMGVTVNGESATFTPVEVGMPMGETVKVNLYNGDDQYSNMGNATNRTWFVFKEEVTSSGMVKLLLGTTVSMSNFPKATVGMSLTDATGVTWSVDSITLQVSTDGTDWTTATNNGDGHFSAMGLGGLSDGTASNVYVKLTVNGNAYTTDGAAPSGSNDYQTLVVIPGGMGGM